jgi:perosamine synthetase
VRSSDSEETRRNSRMNIPAARIYFPEEDRKELLEQIDGILRSGQLTLGKYTKEFEERFAQYIGTKYAIAVNSGTSALEIILRALDIGGSSVIVPTNTFFATPASVIHAGGKVVFADITDNLWLDPESMKRSIQGDTRAVIVVHIGGIIPPQIGEIQQICKEHSLSLVEDAAHAQGSTLNGKKAGSFGIAAAFSFYPTKVMTSGEGGMITTDDEKVYERALVFRDQGKAGFFGNVHTEMGYNWRMSEIHAAIGLSQFARLEEFIADRRKTARIYDEELTKINGMTPVTIPSEVKSNYYKYIALLKDGIDRASLKKEMKDRYGVGLSGEVYELPCHLQPVFKDLYGFKGGELPVAEGLCQRQICLPVFAGMTKEQARYVVDSLRRAIQEERKAIKS